MSGPTAVLDACVLIPYRLATTLLWLAEAGLYQPLWSDQILDEVERNLPKLGVRPEQAARRVGRMRDAFGAEALVDGFGDLIEEMECDPKDRHVLAAAAHDGADALLTFNIKDFPAEAAEPHGLQILHPDKFLLQLLAAEPTRVTAALTAAVQDLRKPPETVTGWLASLTSTVPTFANLAADAAREPPTPLSPIPALMASDEKTALASLGEFGDLTNPAQVAMAWWAGILRDLDLARALSYDPSAWGDYQWAIHHIAGMSLASKVIPAIDAPDRIAFMRFVPEVAQPSQVFQSYLAAATIVTLCRVDDGTWRVWGLGPGMVSEREIFDG